MEKTRSLRTVYGTLEPAPSTYLYRGSKSDGRAGLQTLLNVKHHLPPSLHATRTPRNIDRKSNAPKRQFGTGTVFMRCVNSIMGVIAFLRVCWVAGHAGLGYASLVVTVGLITTFITSLSLAAISSNGEIGGGGLFWLISRNLGPAWGGSIGMLYCIAMAVGTALHTFGFAETITSFYTDPFTSSFVWDQRVICLIAIFIMLFVAIFGISFVMKLQTLLMIFLLVAIMSFLLGTVIPVSEATGYTGFSWDTLKSNYSPVWGDQSLAIVFAVYFPAAGGLLAGSSVSAELKDPQKSIGIGTFAAVIVTNVLYYLIVFLACGSVQGATLRENTLIMKDVSLWAPLLYAGLFAASLSSAISSLDSAPRILQAVAQDEIFPSKIVSFFAKMSKSGEPIRAYILSFIVAQICVLVGDLNLIAPILSNFMLLSYTLLNYAVFAIHRSEAISWRPSWKFYHPYVSLIGAIVSLASMLYMNLLFGLVSIIICLLFYYIIDKAGPEVNWGTCADSALYVEAVLNTLKLSALKSHIKTYRPSFLVFSSCTLQDVRQSSLMDGTTTDESDMELEIKIDFMEEEEEKEEQRVSRISQSVTQHNLYGSPSVLDLQLLAFVQTLWKSRGVVVCGHGIITEDETETVQELRLELLLRSNRLRQELTDFVQIHNIKGFVDVVHSNDRISALDQLLQSSGVGALRPNTAVFRLDIIRKPEELVETINHVLLSNHAIMLCSNIQNCVFDVGNMAWEKKTIDLWWMSDDGGFSLLIPFIMRLNEGYENLEFRIFSISTSKNPKKIAKHAATFSKMLSMFRIKATVETPNMIKSEVNHESETAQKIASLALTVKQYSMNAAYVYITLPLPNKISADQYCHLLHDLTDDLPPTILLRGTNEPVLTFDG
ncbi:hypothetical protein PCE1_002719 [Barthelona sp. PCE]